MTENVPTDLYLDKDKDERSHKKSKISDTRNYC